MTREEEIRQAATEYADDYGCIKSDQREIHTAFIDGAEWAALHQQSHWHSIADGDLPEKKGNYLCSDGEEFVVAYYSRASGRFFNPLERYGGDYNDWIKYWMEIPILQIK